MVERRDTTILLIEDDTTMCQVIQTVLEKEGYRVVPTGDGPEGSRLFHENPPDLVITDLKLPGKSGMHLLKEFLVSKSTVPVILISAYGTIDLAVNALKSGARDFIAKPFSIDELRTKVKQIIEEIPPKEVKVEAVPTFHGMVGSSGSMEVIYQQIKQVSRVDSPVLITGESGTGKELIARAIHQESSRRKRPFLAVNCGSFTDTLLQSELFGHEKGSFTGAIRQHKGIFEQADGGSILLDEVGEISPLMQVKLLRVMQNQAFQRVGGSEEISTDVRMVFATNKDLKSAVKNGDFREDLFFRLNVIPLHVPPLRERPSDMPELIDYIMQMKCQNLGRERPFLTGEAVDRLTQYPWPGNIRELENFLERMLVFSEKKTITGKDIYLDDEGETLSGTGTDLEQALAETEYRMIVRALKRAGGVKRRAAEILGIKTSTLYYKLEKYGLTDLPGKDNG